MPKLVYFTIWKYLNMALSKEEYAKGGIENGRKNNWLEMGY